MRAHATSLLSCNCGSFPTLRAIPRTSASPVPCPSSLRGQKSEVRWRSAERGTWNSELNSRFAAVTPKDAALTPRKFGLSPAESGLAPQKFGSPPQKSEVIPAKFGFAPQKSEVFPTKFGLSFTKYGASPQKFGLSPAKFWQPPTLTEQAPGQLFARLRRRQSQGYCPFQRFSFQLSAFPTLNSQPSTLNSNTTLN